jgi:PAS domain S-box-containing protein
MSTTLNLESGDTVDSLARARYAAMQRANTLLHVEEPAASVPAEKFSGVSALLVSSLEELRVAEEELRVQNVELVTQRAANDERTRYYRQLFLHAPVPVAVTDIFGTIQEVNIAAGRLFRRDPDFLRRKPLAALVPQTEREVFRRRLRRLLDDQGAKEWTLCIERNGDVPSVVHATVTRIPDVGPTRSGMLYWLMWPQSARGDDDIGVR